MLPHSDMQTVPMTQNPVIQRVQAVKNHQNYNCFISLTDVLPSSSSSSSVSHGPTSSKKDIYVCTFCQVFSPNLATVTTHISANHSESLPEGTRPENFASKLQRLEENSKEKGGKVGRPRKNPSEKITPEKTKQKIVDPVPDSEGLFWCKTCLRYFKKSRQLIQHICVKNEEEISTEESSNEFEADVEFKTHMTVDHVPWSRIKKVTKLKENFINPVNSKTRSNEASVPESENKNKVLPNWRNDPTYVPLFDNETEKAAFEAHLKSIDYSYVDILFQIEEKRCRNKAKSNNCTNVQSLVYTCNICKKNFKSLSLIRPHCLTHTDLKPFTCPKCSYRTNSSGSLYMHMRLHTGNMFWCSHCDFKCMKRSHLIDHEATHSTIYQICKLCKNSYKTVRSLVFHVRKYHNHSGGKKYIQSLTGKQSKVFKCDICNKKFRSLTILNNHNHACHEITDVNPTEEGVPVPNLEDINPAVDDIQMQISDVNNVELSNADLKINGVQNKDPLAEIVLSDFLNQQQQSQALMYQSVFNHSSEDIGDSSNNNLLNSLQANTMAERIVKESSILEECQKTLHLDILEECLQNNGFSNDCQEFNLIPNISRRHSLQTSSSDNDLDVANHLSDISEDKMEEPKSVEIKLFEKCQRAPAYVCCVCSSIYICTATLKVHLREHVNYTISSIMNQAEEQFEPAKITESRNEINVCDLLQDSSESISFDKELEKLYTSSLDLMYYLPEVSVVLENDAALFDSMLDDISSNFPISDNAAEDLNAKDEEESVLKCFSEI